MPPELGVHKVVADAAAAVADIAHGSSLAVGGFGICGAPLALIDAVHALGPHDLQVVSNNCGIDGLGLAILLADRRISRMISSFVGDNKEFARQYLAGELEVELTPQGTLAERLRAGGAGIPAFFTPSGVGTEVADGTLPWRYAPDGSVALYGPAKQVQEFNGKAFILEHAINCDFALVHAAKGDAAGNLVFAKTARNFNPLCAMAGQVTIAEVEQLVQPGDLDPDEVHLPGIFVQRIVEVGVAVDKPIEKRTVRPGEAAAS